MFTGKHFMKKISVTCYLFIFLFFSLITTGCGIFGGDDENNDSPFIDLPIDLPISNPGENPIIAEITKISGSIQLSQSLSALTNSQGLSLASNSIIKKAAALDNLKEVTISLYDADHPEWLYPVAESTAAIEGTELVYTLDVLKNADKNLAADGTAAYTDADSIPAGHYTLIARGKEFSPDGAFNKKYFLQDFDTGQPYRPVVAVQALVKKFVGTMAGNKLVVQSSEASPEVIAIMGERVDRLNSENGKLQLNNVPANAAIQVIFNMSMHRVSTPEAIALTTDAGGVIEGSWKMTPDLTAATFYPVSPLTEGSSYLITISKNKTANYYSRRLKSDLVAAFGAKEVDSLSPGISKKAPAHGDVVEITTTIEIQFNEPIDVNFINIDAKSKKVGTTDFLADGLGPKPSLKALGDNWYQIIPSKPLELNTVYELTVDGATDLAGNAMVIAQWQFQTEETSVGVDQNASNETQAIQSTVKSILGNFINALNKSDTGLLSSLLMGDFELVYDQMSSSQCESDQMCNYDADKDDVLNYEEFIKFISAWFETLTQDTAWTGDNTGNHIVGDVPAGLQIKVDETEGKALIPFEFKTVDSSGTAIVDTEVRLHMLLININNGWFISVMSDQSMRGPGADSIKNIVTTAPTAAQVFDAGTALVSFTWEAVANATAYGIILEDNITEDTGWLALVNGSTLTVNYTKASDYDGTDGTLVLPGGSRGARHAFPIGSLKNGGSYRWSVFALTSLTAADFIGSHDIASDTFARSPISEFSIGGEYISAITVAMKTIPLDSNAPKTAYTYDTSTELWSTPVTTGVDSVDLTFDNSAVTTSNYVGDVWLLSSGDAGNLKIDMDGDWIPLDSTPKMHAIDQIVLDITTTSGAADGFVEVRGEHVDKKRFTFTNGKGSVTIPLFTGFNDLIVSDGTNMWVPGNNTTNTVFTPEGVSFDLLTIDKVADSNNVLLQRGNFGGFHLTGGTSVIISGRANSATLIVENNYETIAGMGAFVNQIDTVNQAFEATVNVVAGGNRISISNGFEFRNIFIKSDAGVDTGQIQKPIDNIQVNGSTPVSSGHVPVYQVTSSVINITGTMASTGNGEFEIYSGNNPPIFGILFNENGLFNLPEALRNPRAHIVLRDQYGFMQEIDIENTSTTIEVPHMVTKIDQVDFSTLPYPYDTSACSIAIEGKSLSSSYKEIRYRNYMMGGMDQTTYADANGIYSITVSLIQGPNNIEIIDSIGIPFFVDVNSGCSDGYTFIEFNVTGVTDPNGTALTGMYGDYDGLANDSIIINGTAPGGSDSYLFFRVQGDQPGLFRSFEVLVPGSGTNANKFSQPVELFTGFNNIQVDFAGRVIDVNVKTTGGITNFVQPIEVVYVSNSQRVGPVEPGWSDWDSNSHSVTINGNVDTVNFGQGTYMHHQKAMQGTVNISNNAFSLTLDLVPGPNNITISDGTMNKYELNIYAPNFGGGGGGQLLTINSPADGSDQSGTITVNGTVMTSFKYSHIRAFIPDPSFGQRIIASTDTYDQTNNGSSPITVTGDNFTFPLTVPDTNPLGIEIRIWDDMGFEAGMAMVNINGGSFKNEPPMAAVEFSYLTTSIGTPAELNGSLSYDPEGQPLTYKWTVIASPAGSVVNMTYEFTAFPQFSADTEGQYTVSLVVSDGFISSYNPTEIMIDVFGSTTNLPPIAFINEHNVTVGLNQVLALDGSGSTDDGTIVTYQWDLGPAATTGASIAANGSQADFTGTIVGTYFVGLIVIDDLGAASQKFVVTIDVTNGPILSAMTTPDINTSLTSLASGPVTGISGSYTYDGQEMVNVQWMFQAFPGMGNSGAQPPFLTGPDTYNPVFTPTVAGKYVLRMEVSTTTLRDFADIVINIAP